MEINKEIKLGDTVIITTKGYHASTHPWNSALNSPYDKGERLELDKTYIVEAVDYSFDYLGKGVLKLNGIAYGIVGVKLHQSKKLQDALNIIYKDE